ncbi:hypothetical protein HDU79_004406 [Rhizoclosmatium sp. JEL0117]|nr:hypothetical protein HDU79_004406 [Rhizoclosmatium sp. JEL0117]
MTSRDGRLKEARQNVDRCNRTLARDRNDLERKERQLMAQIRHFAAKGDLVKARIAARQISHYRQASDRNYESSAMIQTRAQLMVSNHKINQAKIEALKGSRYADMYDSIETVASREMKYAHMMGVQEEMERIMNEGMDDVYETAEELIKKRDYFDLETEAILKQALDPKQYNGRLYTDPATTTSSTQSNSTLQKITIHFKLYNPSASTQSLNPDPTTTTSNTLLSRFPDTPNTNPQHSQDFDVTPLSTPILTSKPLPPPNNPSKPIGASLKITTLDLSIDMLKRLMIRDAYLLAQLRLQATKKSMYDVVLGSSRSFRVGWVNAETGAFEEFDFVKSLKECGVGEGGVVWVLSDE